MMIAVGSVKGSPGATTFALALAVCWPAATAVMVEADPAGGDLGGRFGVPDVPGLAGLAVHARRERGPKLWPAYAHRLPVGADTVIAPAAGRQAHAAVAQLAEHLPQHAGMDLIVDVGRLQERSPAWALVAAVDAVLLVSGVDVASVDHTAAFTRTEQAKPLSVVLIGDSRFTPRELADVFRVPVAVHAPVDRRSAAVLTGADRPGRGWTRVGLPAAARTVALQLQTRQASAGRSAPVPVPIDGHDVPVAVEGGTR